MCAINDSLRVEAFCLIRRLLDHTGMDRTMTREDADKFVDLAPYSDCLLDAITACYGARLGAIDVVGIIRAIIFAAEQGATE